MDENKLREVFERLENYLEDLGWEKQEVSEDSIDGSSYLIMNVRMGNEPLQFIGSLDQDWSHVILRYPFDIVDNLAVDLERKDDVQRALDESIDKDYIKGAQRKLKDMDVEWSKVKYGLAERLISENCHFNLEQSEELPLKGFHVDKRIFPEENFGLKDLDSAIQTVIGRSSMGRLWLAECLGKTEELFSEGPTEFDAEDSEDKDLGYIG